MCLWVIYSMVGMNWFMYSHQLLNIKFSKKSIRNIERMVPLYQQATWDNMQTTETLVSAEVKVVLGVCIVHGPKNYNTHYLWRCRQTTGPPVLFGCRIGRLYLLKHEQSIQCDYKSYYFINSMHKMLKKKLLATIKWIKKL